jgi:hypothetical protein
VEQLKEVYEEDLKAFVEKVVAGVRDLIRPAQLCRRTFQPLEWLWIGEDEQKEWEEGGGVSLWFSLRQPEIIRGGRLNVHVLSETDTKQLDRVVAHPDFPLRPTDVTTASMCKSIYVLVTPSKSPPPCWSRCSKPWTPATRLSRRSSASHRVADDAGSRFGLFRATFGGLLSDSLVRPKRAHADGSF